MTRHRVFHGTVTPRRHDHSIRLSVGSDNRGVFMTSTISTTNGAYTAATGKARELTEKSVETFKQGVEKFTEQANVVAWIPEVDLTESVTRYFEYVQKSVDFNRDLAVRWAEIVTSLYGTVRDQADKVTGIVKDQTNKVADQTVQQARKARDLANEQANVIEEAKKEGEKQAKAAERAAARRADKEAREQYEGLTKAELSDLLAERELPKSGTVEELIERLVSADSE
jgi:coenzyme F420-reducing hydrogenase alpha subunit